MKTSSEEEQVVGSAPSNIIERASRNLPKWEGSQKVTGLYAPQNRTLEWPNELAALDIVLWRGHAQQVGWDGREVWIEPDKAKALQDGEACALLMLQKIGAIGGIKPKNTYFVLVQKAQPYLDPVNGGIFAGSYGLLRSEEIERLCKADRERLRIQKLKKGVVVVMGFPPECGDQEIRSLLGDAEVYNFFRFPQLPNKNGLARAQLEHNAAQALCTRAAAQWDEGMPLRIRGYPVRIEWADNQSCFDYKRR